MSYVRFPMMSHHQLSDLLLNPLSDSHTSMILDKIRAGLRFHKGGEVLDSTGIDNRIYTPRYYQIQISRIFPRYKIKSLGLRYALL